MTPLQIKNEIERAENCAQRNGFKLHIGDAISISATGAPYMKGAIVLELPSFHDVITYFTGYEQMKLEHEALNREKK
jgi:hypothetical protein